MIRAGNALEALIAGLRGGPIATPDVRAVIALANHTLLTPALFSSLARTGEIDRLPQDAREYLSFIHESNRQRNLRLRAQLNEAVAALNRCGITPVLLKGAVPLFLSPVDRLPSRMASDLDVSVEAADELRARACLERLGYVQVTGARGMARPQDVGILELRQSRAGGFETPNLVERNGLLAKIPSVQSRALHWILHDLLKEGDYWRGRIDLRHLHDLAELAEAEGVDWKALRASLPDQTARNALDAQLLALHQFFDIRIPAEWARRPIVRLQHWRRVFTAKHPVMGAPLRLAGNVAWGVRRVSRGDGLTRRRPVDLARRIVRTLFDLDIRAKV
ncbi:nucleotidyltransferase family protein [Pseudaminobacter sp. 19-2017]|uniref:Nucleotidyltransferase family protein n=1 Tax=Pseudaminobacter soli (ex Zhang et al. 2022) TaxID=2831468 RepID=A0A942EAW0_9HYPH|nr:nucleotidyltransferase family protein [Pseudaminobacter soli]MBS3651687.1 nucleotidyltransferase family protein [Pseudaminobacter soli]